MQPSRNFDDLKFSSIHRRILLWGSGGPFLDGYVLVMIGVALEQLTPALKLDADWIGLLGAGTLAGLFVGTSLFGYISDKVGRRKMFLIDIIAIGVISVATMFVSSPVELLVMRVLIGIVIGADYPIATSMITEFSSTRQRAFSISFIAAMWYVGATCADLVGYWLYDVEGGWRWMLGSAAIPCLLILIGRFELPESPRWLLRKGRVKECEEMMIKLFGEPVAFEEEQPQQTRFRDLFNRRHFPFVLFVAAIWTCQVIPMFAIYTFGPQIVGLLGLGVGKNAHPQDRQHCRSSSRRDSAGCRRPALVAFQQQQGEPSRGIGRVQGSGQAVHECSEEAHHRHIQWPNQRANIHQRCE